MKEVSGKATKEAAEADRPALIGRVLTAKGRQELRYGPHSRKSYGGVLTVDNGWRLYGLESAPTDPTSQAKGGQSKIASFFGAGAGGGGANRSGSTSSGVSSHPSRGGDIGDGSHREGGAMAIGETPAAASSRSPTASRHEPGTPGTSDAVAALEDDIVRWGAEVEKLKAARLAISLASGHEEGQPLLLHNHASALANATRLLDAAMRKRSRLNGTTPPFARE